MTRKCAMSEEAAEMVLVSVERRAESCRKRSSLRYERMHVTEMMLATV